MKALLISFVLLSLVGKPLPQWKPGQLDIHVINAGRGECSYIILPDATTIAVDAGEFITYVPSKYGKVDPKPDADTRPAEVYARYMQHFLPAASRDSLDYFVLTHYHMDHMGCVEDGVVEGVPALYERVPFRTLLDRSYPDYSDAVRTGGTAKNLQFYSDFVNSAVSRGLDAQRFEVGADAQIVPVHKSGSCTVVNYGASGVAFDGCSLVETGADRENAMSCSFLLTYGKFDYWTSGDNNFLPQVKTTADAIGPRVDAQKCVHHMSNPEIVEYEASVMQPQVILTTSFYKRVEQPQQSVIRNLAGQHDLFFTNIDQSVIDTDAELYAQCKAINGHYVIRVSKGGRKFRVYQLDDTDFSYRVKAVFGPYKCR